MNLSHFDYHLPRELIAQYPVKRRDASRLLVLDRKKKELLHRRFTNLMDYLREGDSLVLNDTKVIPARLVGRKRRTGGKVDILLLARVNRDTFTCLVKPNRRVRNGETVYFNGKGLAGEVVDGGIYDGVPARSIRFNHIKEPLLALKKIGRLPLPPYIKREPAAGDKKRYQTVYAREEGAIAAPTAGLHFTRRLLKEIAAKGVNISFLTLHVGYGTFRPVRAERIAEHKMQREYFNLSPETAGILNKTKQKGGRVFAVGTTTARVLETIADPKGELKAKRGWTDLFIHPPYKFKCVDVLLTNFHLPRTTLLMLVSAFAGKDFIIRAYQQAIDKGYRFYSYGDAMLII